MKTLTILVGPPGSGKSSYANVMAYDPADPNSPVRISQDDQGKTGHMDLFLANLDGIHNVIVDRMNFSKEQRARYIKPAREAGYRIVIKTFFMPRDVCMDRCLHRQDHPTIKTEEDATKALDFFFKSFERPTEDEADELVWDYAKISNIPAVICDLDGTLCNIDHRLHHVRGPGKKDWAAFMQRIPYDTPNEWCVELITKMSPKYEIVFCSGRSENERRVTEIWLEVHLFNKMPGLYDIYMRPAKDYRQDSVIKEIILDFELLPRYDILFCVDDRKQVVDMWRGRGLVCLQCAPGDF